MPCPRCGGKKKLVAEDNLNDLYDCPTCTQWTRSEAIELVQRLEPIVEKVGFGVGLTGSVLTKGFSKNDLDLIIYPLSTETIHMPGLRLVLRHVGLKLACSRAVVAKMWEHQGSSDMKNVERWKDDYDRKIDIFYLR